MAEAHPALGFQWVMDAKRRGATIIHVDPRSTRTSAVADVHAPIRAGSDIAFLGALINHVCPTIWTSASTWSPTRMPQASLSPIPRHRGRRRPILRLRPRDRALRPDYLALRAATAALIANTAIPAWHEAHRELPFAFGGSAAAAAGEWR
jgi:hypothetical protein